MQSQPTRKTGAGFTLIEIAVSLFILTLVISALLGPMAVQVEERQVRETERIMNEMLEALVGFAVTQPTPRLPCPDLTTGGLGGTYNTANDGVEDYDVSGACSTIDGNIPWAQLGVSATDAWGNRYRYLVSRAFSDRTPAMTLSSPSTLKVCTRFPLDNSCTVTDPITLVNVPNSYAANGVPAIIISHGKNSYGAMNASSNTQTSTTGASPHETENAIGSQSESVVSKIRSNAAAEAFDDIVVWLSPNVLFNRLITANKLP